MDFINEQKAFPLKKKEDGNVCFTNLFLSLVSSVFILFYIIRRAGKLGKSGRMTYLKLDSSPWKIIHSYVHKKRSECVTRLLCGTITSPAYRFILFFIDFGFGYKY